MPQAGADGAGAWWERRGCRAGLGGCLQAHGGNALAVLGVEPILAH